MAVPEPGKPPADDLSKEILPGYKQSRDDVREKRRGNYTEFWTSRRQGTPLQETPPPPQPAPPPPQPTPGVARMAGPELASLQRRCSALEESLRERDRMLASAREQVQASARTAAAEIEALRARLAAVEPWPAIPAPVLTQALEAEILAARRIWIESVRRTLAGR